MKATPRREEPSTALPALRKLVDRTQDVFARHAPPRGLTDREAIIELGRILGSMDARDALILAQHEKKTREVVALAKVIESAVKILIKRADPRGPADYLILEELAEIFENSVGC